MKNSQNEKQITQPRMAKEQLQWHDLISRLDNPNEIEASIKAAKAISKVAGPEHVKELYSLLQSPNFFVRETAAVPLTRLEGIKVLPHLFRAMEQGELDGHDNDSLTNTLIGLIESNKKKVTPLLLDMLKSSENGARADAVWALGFVTAQVEPSIFIDLVRNDKDAEIRSMAASALQSYSGGKKKYPVNTDSFRGRWMWLDTAENLQYGFEIEGAQGICIKSNSPALVNGDVILKIQLADDPV
ncbi:MAG: HEAT repeat domain-containing protein, partial [Bacteroidetes bacterium]|nr:HEAT repeat domain-containing protein [Bacteroidota bacterium]